MGKVYLAVSKWENGRSMPDTSIMLELCALLGITVTDLLNGEVVTMDNYNEKNEQLLLEMAKEFGVMGKTTFTSFAFEYIQTIKELEPAARVGWLTSDTSDGAIERLLAIGDEEMAPKASTVTEELMKKWRGAGLGVRAWGVTSIELMKQMCHLGVDGMTVNFPDKLIAYMKER